MLKRVGAEIDAWFGIHGVVHKNWWIKVTLQNMMHGTY